MYSSTENMINRLPDVLNKEANSNIYKLYQVIGEELNEIYNVFQDIKLMRDIDEAYGKSLDYIGEQNLNLKRNGLSDEEYRMVLKLKIASKKGAVINVLIESLATLLNIDISQVFLQRAKEYDSSFEPASVAAAFPQEVIDNLEVSYFNVIDFIETIIAGGVNIQSIFKDDTRIAIQANTSFETFYSAPLCGTILSGEYPGNIFL